MLTRPEAADPAVEELKRRARRRLVGAIVLALAAAVVLPLLLESDPKPLGDDVSIQIPPIDSGKFITPLSPAKALDGKPATDRSGTGTSTPRAPPKPSAAAPDAAVDTKPATAPSSKQIATAKQVETAQQSGIDAAVPAAATASSVASSDSAGQKVGTSPSKAQHGAARPDAGSPAGAFVVQLAAFADAKAAPALASKLKSAGFPVYTETLKTPQGTMRRVRVGPYATREVADAELARLAQAGYRGVVAAK